MISPSLDDFQKEFVFLHRKKRSLWNLLWGIFITGFTVPALVYTEKYYYAVLIFLGLSRLWDYFFPGTDQLIIKAGYAWSRGLSLNDKLNPENKIEKVETYDVSTIISTKKESYFIDHIDLSLEELCRLDHLKKCLAEQSKQENK